MFLSIGLRPFFLLAGLYACAAMAVWLAWLGLGFAPFPAASGSAAVPIAIWHGHEMVFGYAAAVIAGFMLTAVPNWTASRPLRGTPLAALALLWLAGRIVVWLSGILPAAVVATIDLAFLPALAATVGVPLIRARAFRNIIFLGLLAVAFSGNAMVHLELLGWSADTARAGNLLGLNLVVLLITIVGGRIVPAFTGNWLKARGIAATVRRRPPLDALAIAATALVLVLELAGAADVLTGIVALAAAVLHLARMAGWQTRFVLGEPIVWILHLGYGWLVVGFLCKALAALGGVIIPASAMHALSVGAVGSMTLGVMTRATLGHTGRALRVAPAIAIAYLLVSLAAVLRIAGPTLFAEVTSGVMLFSGLLWVLAFGVFVAKYWIILTGPNASA